MTTHDDFYKRRLRLSPRRPAAAAPQRDKFDTVILDRHPRERHCFRGLTLGDAMFGLRNALALFVGAPAPDLGLLGRGKEWCVLALLYAAARSDADTLAPEEEVTLAALAMRTPTLFKLSPELYNTYLADYRELLRGRNSVSALVEAACASLPRQDGLAEAIFAQCADMVMADREVVSLEDEFLRDLATELRLSGSKTREIMQVMRWKNELREAG